MHSIIRYLSIFFALLALSSAASLSSRRLRLKSQRQVELTTPTPTPYPAAGFRPDIAFELPNEQQPKVAVFEAELEPLTTTTPLSTSVAAEEFDVDQLTTTELEVEQVQEKEQEVEQEAAARTPANTYGAPAQQPSEQEEDTVEVVAQAPAEDFQPPTREAVEDFTAAAAGAADEQQFVVDIPALGQTDEQEVANESGLSVKAAATPAVTYGAPSVKVKVQQLPAATYGLPEPTEPELTLEEPENELELDTSEVELVSELNSADLAMGRLILLPVGARGSKGSRFGRLVLAVPQRRLRNDRLRRL